MTVHPKKSELHWILLRFISDREIAQVYETPKRLTVSKSYRWIVKQEVKKLYKHIGYAVEKIVLNLDRFKVDNDRGFIIISFKKWQVVRVDK